ncbi:MAG: PilN domain-containing protein [Deltaproteobacteria bacterium]|nr:PilN domain-containing protein [Deltaproteobacteria bacterium]
MIQRINLIEREPFKFSYQRLIHAVVGVILFCAFIYGIQIVRVVAGHSKLKRLHQEMAELKVEQERLLKRVEPEWKGSAAAERLKSVFAGAPVWSDVLDDLAQRLPGSVWLTGFETSGNEAEKQEEKEVKKEGKKEVKKETRKRTGLFLELRGRAKSAADLSLFMARLEESPHISKAVLRDSKIDNGDFAFEVECDIMARP